MILLRMKQRYLPDILHIEKLSFSIPWSEKSFKQEIFNPGSHPYVVMGESGKSKIRIALGYIILNTVLDEGYIVNLAVLPQMRHKGIGKSLVTYILEQAKKLNLSFVSLEVRTSNKPAINLYESLGFECLGTRKDYYSNPKEDAVIMTKIIKDVQQ